jgi:hypothetical protein
VRGQPFRGGRAELPQAAVEPEPVADHGVASVHRSTQVGDEPAEQIVELAFIDGHRGLPTSGAGCGRRVLVASR